METLLMLSQGFGYLVALILFVTFACWISADDLADLIAIDLPYVSTVPSFQPATLEASSVQPASVKARAAYSEALGYSDAFDRAALSPAYLAAWERVEHPDDAEVIRDLSAYLLTLYPEGRPHHPLN